MKQNCFLFLLFKARKPFKGALQRGDIALLLFSFFFFVNLQCVCVAKWSLPNPQCITGAARGEEPDRRDSAGGDAIIVTDLVSFLLLCRCCPSCYLETHSARCTSGLLLTPAASGQPSPGVACLSPSTSLNSTQRFKWVLFFPSDLSEIDQVPVDSPQVGFFHTSALMWSPIDAFVCAQWGVAAAVRGNLSEGRWRSVVHTELLLFTPLKVIFYDESR